MGSRHGLGTGKIKLVSDTGNGQIETEGQTGTQWDWTVTGKVGLAGRKVGLGSDWGKEGSGQTETGLGCDGAGRAAARLAADGLSLHEPPDEASRTGLVSTQSASR